MVMPEKVALITGASRGIGQAVAKRCQEEGYTVIAVSRSRPNLPNLEWVEADLSRVEGCSEVLNHPSLRDRVLSLLVSNAGLAGSQEVLGTPADWRQWRNLLGVNLDASYYLLSSLCAQLKDQQARVVLVGSVLSIMGVPDQPAYTAAKHGLLGLTRSFALRLAPRGITVNLVCPGWTRTAMAIQRAQELGCSAEDLPKEVPLGRWIEPEEIASLVAYLASAAAKNLTGQSLVLDGGASL